MKRRDVLRALGLTSLAAASALPRPAAAMPPPLPGTGDMGVIIERATGSVLIINTTRKEILGRVKGLGDLSHASAVFSRDEKYAYVFGRDGGLTKVDIQERHIAGRVMQGGNSIGGAISDDGTLVAVSNYKPGGIKVFDSETLKLVADIPATWSGGRSKTVGLVDAPGRRFVYALYDAGEIWMTDFSSGKPVTEKIGRAGRLPYDGLVAQGGRIYIAGLFGEDGMAKVDLWKEPLRIERILDGYGRGEKKLPVYKMPHLEGWTEAAGMFFFPAVGHHEVLVMDARTWKLTGKIPVHGQPVFVMGRPDGRHVWVNFAHPLNDTVQVIDTQTLKIIRTFTPGPAVLHMEFTPRGEQVWISVRDKNRVDIYDTHALKRVKTLEAKAPSGIFFTARAHKIGL